VPKKKTKPQTERLALNLRLPAGGREAVRAAAMAEGRPLANWAARVLLRAARAET